MHNVHGPLNYLKMGAFRYLKVLLNSDLLLMHYDQQLSFGVAVEASDFWVGAVIWNSFPTDPKDRSHTRQERRPWLKIATEESKKP